jgi:hypothetical protein
MIWNIEKAKCVNRFMYQEHFVQGASWDPIEINIPISQKLENF